ncbi:hypothetical protein F52700_4492 [Fusarium sp. NRRL 52700]|nr:hypothetical protein F52700_4492 [Fusarium sp. NRRL 52700]
MLGRWLCTFFSCCRRGVPPDCSKEVENVHPMKMDEVNNPMSVEMHNIESPKSTTNSQNQQATLDNHQTKKLKIELDGLVTPRTVAASDERHTEGSVTTIQDSFDSSTGLLMQPTTSHNYQTTKAELEPEWSLAPKNLSPSENPHTDGPVNAIKEKLDEPSTASKFSVLPDEIVFIILRQIYEGTDQQSRLKQSNRVFRNAHCFEHKIRCKDTTGLSNLVRKDKICEGCQLQVDKRQRHGVSLTCKFAARDNKDWVYCCKCFVEHPSSCFSRGELQKDSKRSCIAKTGYIRLCEHKVLFWDDIDPQTTRAGGFIEIENCTHPSHMENDLRHKEIPSAKIGGSDHGYLSLLLSFTVVSAERCRNFVAGQNSKVAADQVLEAIRYVRQRGAQSILPERSTKAPPEMDAFITPENPAAEERMWTPISKWPKDGEVKDRDDWGKRAIGQSVFCEPRHYGPDKSITRLCFLYERKICVRNSNWYGPSHDWYYAISSESYTYSGTSGVPGSCSNPSCRNHYPFATNPKRHRIRVYRDMWSGQRTWY